MLDKFAIQGGSVIGSYHHKGFKNNQDALTIATTERVVIGLVSDGCGSGRHSEVGAKLGVRFMANHLRQMIEICPDELPNDWEYFLNDAARQFLLSLRRFNQCLGIVEAPDTYSYWLFTLVGFILTEERTIIFSFGDGVISLNGEVTEIDQNNEPEYLTYGSAKVKIQHDLPTSEVDSLLIATDGFSELFERSEEDISLLGKEMKVGDLLDFETGSKYLKNKALVQKRLNVLGNNHKLLHDDTTVILVRKQELQIPITNI
ncbi:hypothetical protein HN858_04850 [Candidatus Falkowbacteria bacterium]|jgi:serine/threonine protein phosphatase PrpC|nr:hypothetical protein [Candidatus Falkowbacteria bacterium]MBT6574421.1 hypothetical protein [Candidatus Falkowbacteria bacterium]MBT7348969.1 hypothetical protein [Candidatus Falkowbacteria bacterium]MBT7500304.1 hypothetical protein [Candidatus Falkowbacteria bacterium]